MANLGALYSPQLARNYCFGSDQLQGASGYFIQSPPLLHTLCQSASMLSKV